jgi:iron complex transport system ATP-binding protein
MLTAINLVYKAGGRALVDGVSATFEPGRFHLIVGPNGAGKSTLVKLLARLLQPHAGSVVYEAADAKRWNERELARRRATLSQAIDVAFPIPVRELVMMGRYPHFRGRPGPLDEAVCDDVMGYADVAELAERDYATLSGGEQQRVNFARVLAQIWKPLEDSRRYLFLDEPLTFLDIRHQIDFMKKVREFASQPDVVAVGVVHDLNLAIRFADRLILLHQGRILADGNAAHVLTAGNLSRAFDVNPAFITNQADGRVYISYD